MICFTYFYYIFIRKKKIMFFGDIMRRENIVTEKLGGWRGRQREMSSSCFCCCCCSSCSSCRCCCLLIPHWNIGPQQTQVKPASCSCFHVLSISVISVSKSLLHLCFMPPYFFVVAMLVPVKELFSDAISRFSHYVIISTSVVVFFSTLSAWFILQFFFAFSILHWL